MNRLERLACGLLLRIAQAERAITFAAFVLLIAILFGDVLMREATGVGIIWARQAAVYANLLLTLVGIGLASAGGTHLRPRFADTWLPASWSPAVARLQDFLMAAFCCAFAIIGIAAVLETRSLAERTSLPPWPVWPFEIVIPVVFAVASLRHLILAVFPRLGPGLEPGTEQPDAAKQVGQVSGGSR